MAEVINNRVCLGLSDLEGIITLSALKHMSSRGADIVAQRACRNTPALYYVDSLPYKYRCEVYKRFPDLQEKAQSKPYIERITPDGEAFNYFDTYAFEDGSYLQSDKIEEYSNNATILRHFGQILDKSNGMRIKTGHSKCPKGEFWAKAATALERISDEYPNSLPRNARRLQEKYNLLMKEGYSSLISSKHGNSNASKVNTAEKKDVISALCALPNGLDNEVICKAYNTAATKLGWESISTATVSKYRKENGLYIDALRNGNNHFSNTKAMQVARRRPKSAMLMWSLDGWTAELYYQKRNSKGVVTYSNRKVIEVVIDTCCDFPIGYAIGDQENSELIAAALRNAANYTKELFGSRYKVNQIQSDHFAMSAMSPYYATVSDLVTPARVGNAKAKPIERYFSYLNKNYCRLCGNSSGTGITSKTGKMNTEWLNNNKKNFPDEAGVIAQLEGIIAAERARKMEEYLKFWEATPEKRRLPLADESFLLRFGKTTGNTNVLEGSGVRPRIGGHRYQYDCFDVKFRELSAYLRWELRYDESDMSHVLAVSEDGKHRFMLEEKYVQPMALVERSEGDAQQLARTFRFNDSMLSAINDRMQQITNHVAPIINGISGSRQVECLDAKNSLAKNLITDSRGQHKTPSAEAREQINDEIKEERAKIEIVRVTTQKKERKRALTATGGDTEVINTFDLY